MTATEPYFGPATSYYADEPPAAPTAYVPRRSHERLWLVALLTGTAVLYLWGLGASGYANEFYAAAVQAGTQSWKAFFFGSFDSSNFITVDKPPLSLWPMELSGRLFGFNSWSMLVPQALEGVASVWLLYAAVKRWFGSWAGLLSGALLAVTPVAVLMFRFNNPDAMMTFLLVAAAYCVTRALEAASTKWLLASGLVMGLSFLAKGLQPFTVLPAFALAYLICAPTSLRRRIGQLLAAGAAVVVGAGWWVLAVTLTPAADRPYIGGSGNNTALGLAFGYNGLSRITGNSGGGGGAGANFSGSSGIGRLFNSLNGGQIAWLLPTALIGIGAMVALSWRAGRTDRMRAAAIMWGGWLLITGAVLSYASGIIHTYYSVEIAPAIAAVVGIGAVGLWQRRDLPWARLLAAAGVAVSGLWGYALLHRTPTWHAWLAYTVAFAGIVGAALLLTNRRRFAAAAIATSLIAIGGGSTAYALDTAATPHSGSVPSAGPTVAGGFGGGPGGFGNRGSAPSGAPSGGFQGGGPQGGFPGGSAEGGFPGGGFPGGTTQGGTTTGGTGTRPSGGFGGGDNATTTNSALVALLKASTTKWAAATIGSQSAGPLELASGKAVMSIGGFNGGDAAPTLAQFEAFVAKGEIHYYIASGGGFGGGGGGNGSSAITSWVESHYTAKTVGGETVYDLTQAK
jgi:4-amino-4-deoxy-L-arabinose transferase-like glycosyltransferase